MKQSKILVVHGGAPTAVMNASLYGVIDEARRQDKNLQVLGARFGTGGLLKEDFCSLSDIDGEKLPRLLTTPGSLIGTSRTPLQSHHYQQMAAVLRKQGIEYVLFNGGNGTMDACGRLKSADASLKVIGIPKTIDNDIAATDHAPGFGSAARYVALTVRDIAEDVRSLPIHICIVEVMGRNTGWLAASAKLAKQNGPGADLIYIPEEVFDEDRFLDEISELHRRKGYAVVVVSEGLHDKKGQPIVSPLMTIGRAVYYGEVGSHLANLVIKKLNIKARSEKPGIAGRAASLCQSEVDREEAEACGREGLRLALSGQSGKMVSIARSPGPQYACTYPAVDIEQVMMSERTLPEDYRSSTGSHISSSFKPWCQPLVGDLPDTFFDRRNLI